MEYSIGVDIGGTKIVGAIVGHDGSIVHKTVISTPKDGKEVLINVLISLIHQMIEWCKIAHLRVKGIGVGTAGQIHFSEGKVITGTTNIKDWNDIPLRSCLEEHFSLPVWVDNDVNAFTIAELYFGGAIGEQNIVCLSLGTGVGGGIVVNGQLVHGTVGAAAELGHISVDMNGPNCNCGFKGCLEMYASGTAIARMMKERLVEIQGEKGVPEFSSQDVFAQYKEGNGIAIEVVSKMTDALAFAIVSLIHTFNPTMVILGGGVMEDGEWIRKIVSKKISKLGIPSLVQPVRITLASMGIDASVIGAAQQCWIY